MAHLGAGVGGAVSTKGGETPEIGRKRIGSTAKRWGGKVGTVFNHGVDPQLQIIENMGNMTQAERTEKLCLPVGADGRDISLRFRSKDDCNRSCMSSHAPLRGHTW